MEQDIFTLIGQRATCRSFKSDPIPEEVMECLLEAGCKSPSSCGFQSISIIKVTDAAKRKKLAELSRGQRFIAVAPVSLVFCVDYHRMAQVLHREPAPFPGPRQFHSLWMGIVDAAICAQTIVLAAEALGLRSCYNGNILNTMDQVSQLLELPEYVCPAIMLTLGWPKTQHRQPPKYPSSLLVHEDRYQERSDEAVYSAYRRQNRYQKFPLKPQWAEACCTAGQALHGEAYAQRIREDLEEKAGLGPYQYWLGCYYTDEPGYLDFSGYRDYMRRQGFTWLDENKEADK